MNFLPFALTTSALFAGLVVIAAWVFRTSNAPLAVKIALPGLLLALGLASPWHFAAMLGRPVPIAARDLPNGATMIAFQMLDGDTRADLWLREGASTRAYEITVGDDERKALRKAREGQARGDGVTVQTGGKGKPTGLYATPSGGFGVSVTPREQEKTGE